MEVEDGCGTAFEDYVNSHMDTLHVISHLSWVSFVFIFLSLLYAIRTVRLARHGLAVEGKVVAIEQDSEGDTPIIGFMAHDGKEYRFRVTFISGNEDWTLGTSCPVLYHNNDPAKAQINRPAQRWGSVIVLFALGVFLFLFFSVLKFFV